MQVWFKTSSPDKLSFGQPKTEFLLSTRQFGVTEPLLGGQRYHKPQQLECSQQTLARQLGRTEQIKITLQMQPNGLYT